MTRLMVIGLIVLNLLLGLGVWLRSGEKTAQAQIGNAQSDYAILSSTNIQRYEVDILQISTGKLAVLDLDPGNHKLTLQAIHSVTDDLKHR